MSYEEVLADLKKDFGKKIDLSPADVAPYIDKSPDAQMALRKRKTFPIPYEKEGGRIVIKIYDLARYCSKEPSPPPSQTTSPAVEKNRKIALPPLAKNHRRPSLGKTLFDFAANIKKQELQVRFMNELFIELERIYFAKQTPDNLKSRKIKRLGP